MSSQTALLGSVSYPATDQVDSPVVAGGATTGLVRATAPDIGTVKASVFSDVSLTWTLKSGTVSDTQTGKSAVLEVLCKGGDTVTLTAASAAGPAYSLSAGVTFTPAMFSPGGFEIDPGDGSGSPAYVPITIQPSGDTTGATDAAAINFALASGVEVRLKYGATYYINAAINFQNLAGAVLVGFALANMNAGIATKVVWVGATDGTGYALDWNGARFCACRQVGFYGNQSAAGIDSDVGICQNQGNPTYDGSFFNHFQDCYFQNFQNGVQVGSSTDQADTLSFKKCFWYYGSNGVGVSINSSNSLHISLEECTLSAVTYTGGGTATGIYVAAGAGGVKMLDCMTLNNNYGIRLAGTPDVNVSIRSHHSEGEGYPIYADALGNGQHAAIVHVSDFFSYQSQLGLFYFGNADLVYDVNDVLSVVGAGVDDITVNTAAAPTDAFQLWNVSYYGSVKNIAGTVVTVPGIYGHVGVGARTQNLLASLIIGTVVAKDDGSGALNIPGAQGVSTPLLQDPSYGGPYIQLLPNGIVVGPRGTGGNQFDVSGADSIVIKSTAGVPVDGDFTHTPSDGTIVIDSTDSKIYARIGGVWMGATLT